MKSKRGDYCYRCGYWCEAGNELFKTYDAIEDRDVWIVTHTDKAVCEANIAKAKAIKERKAAYKLHESEFRALFAEADMPAAEVVLNGEILLDTFNIYGGGWQIVIDERYVWLVDNNGMDGDDWSRNNIRTGGAGAIGRYLPRTDELEAQARALVTEQAALDS